MDAPIIPMLVVTMLPLMSCAELSPGGSLKALSGADGTPLIGRLETRDRTIDLTRRSIAGGGPAHDVATGVAKVIADIDRGTATAQGRDAPVMRDLPSAGSMPRF